MLNKAGIQEFDSIDNEIIFMKSLTLTKKYDLDKN